MNRSQHPITSLSLCQVLHNVEAVAIPGFRAQRSCRLQTLKLLDHLGSIETNESNSSPYPYAIAISTAWSNHEHPISVGREAAHNSVAPLLFSSTGSHFVTSKFAVNRTDSYQWMMLFNSFIMVDNGPTFKVPTSKPLIACGENIS